MLNEHSVGGRVLVPGVGYLELAFAALNHRVFEAMMLADVSLVQPCVLFDESWSTNKLII